jgi:hypothetical protein
VAHTCVACMYAPEVPYHSARCLWACSSGLPTSRKARNVGARVAANSFVSGQHTITAPTICMTSPRAFTIAAGFWTTTASGSALSRRWMI